MLCSRLCGTRIDRGCKFRGGNQETPAIFPIRCNNASECVFIPLERQTHERTGNSPLLLLQLRNPSHHRAWDEFAAIYRPLVFRLARQKGFQDADAHDLCQEVFAVVARSIERFDAQSNGSFRGWLFRITRNLMINWLTREKQVRGSGDSAVHRLLDQHADEKSDSATHFDLEYRRGVFVWAANHIQPAFAPETWQSFWLTAVDGKSIAEAAQVLGKSQGSVRVARCRVLSQLKKEVNRFLNTDREE